MRIRAMTEPDLPPIADVHQQAFGAGEGPVIVALIEALCQDETARPMLSLVSDLDGRVTGHVMFTAVTIEPSRPAASILAPLAVHPSFQKQGIGKALIRAGLDQLQHDGVSLVFVLGDPAYYTRHGFEPALPYRLSAPYPIPKADHDAWMVQALQPDILGRCTGKLRCADALMPKEYWL